MQAGGSTLQVCFTGALLITSGTIYHGCCLSSCPFCPLQFFGSFFEVSFCDKNVSGPAGNLSKSLRVKGVKNLRCLWGKDNNESDEAQLPSVHLPFNSMIIGTN